MNHENRLSLIAALWALVSPVVAQISTTPPTHEASPTPERYWVFFVDKAGVDAEQEIRELERTYDRRALQRRRLRRTAPGLFDRRDVPVVRAYLDAVTALGARLRVESSWLNAISIEAARDLLESVRALPCVMRIEPVRRLIHRPHVLPASEVPEAGAYALGNPFYGASFAQLQQIRVTDLHALGLTGAGVRVGILDTGFGKTHLGFTDVQNPLSVIAEMDFVDGDGETGPEPGDPSNQHEHGTAVLGTIRAYAPSLVVGGAYDADMILAKCEDVLGESFAEEDLFVAGLQFIEANGGDVATSSLIARDLYTQAELDGVTSTMTLAFNVATDNGVHCFQGAGNDFHDDDPVTSHLQAPADALRVITVGSVESDGSPSSFSSDGPTADGRVKPEVMALGRSVATVDPGNDGLLWLISGTSFATPLTAAAAACLVQAHPDWTVDQMRQALFETTAYYQATGAPDPLHVFGYGLVDALAANEFQSCPGTACCFGVDCPCGNDDPTGGCANSTGQGAVLSAGGSASIAADDLLLLCGRVPAQNNGLFYMGDTHTRVAFFDGFQCALGNTLRFLGSIQSSGAAGTMSYSGVVAESGGLISAGSTWYFHAWFRDVPGSPCGLGANLSNALAVTFLP